MRTTAPSTVHSTPQATSERQPSASGSSRSAGSASRAARTSAWASGCCEGASATAICSHSLPALSKPWDATTEGRPHVSVPVLSSTTACTLFRASKLSTDLTKAPRRLAATPVATITAVGVARPRAQGQAIISTDMLRSSANCQSEKGTRPLRSRGRPIQPRNVAAAMRKIAGTKKEATRSASRWTRGEVSCADSTSRMISASVVELPTAVTSTSALPATSTLPPTSSEPRLFVMASDSPVSSDSSTCTSSSHRSVPSAGIVAPASTRRKSPTCTRSMGRSSSSCLSALTRLARIGRACDISWMAAWVRCLARSSMQRPSSRTSVRTATACRESRNLWASLGRPTATACSAPAEP
mmetsp:Transcript_34232/g.97907  ORF Transcript_34232/g.97907 Transcript_34232/m.97907 type:complete len:355 (+) Transcript_34232:826-1890(+)